MNLLQSGLSTPKMTRLFHNTLLNMYNINVRCLVKNSILLWRSHFGEIFWNQLFFLYAPLTTKTLN